MIQHEFAPSRSWFMVAAFLAFLIIGGFSVYFEIQASKLNSRITDLKIKRESLEQEGGREDPTKLRAAAFSVKDELKKIEAQQFPWSKIIEKIEGTVPKVRDTDEPIVHLRSYLGSTEGKVSVSATTRGFAEDPFADVAFLVRAFVDEPSFKEVFIPSITKSLTPAGDTVLSFSLNFSYEKIPF